MRSGFAVVLGIAVMAAALPACLGESLNSSGLPATSANPTLSAPLHATLACRSSVDGAWAPTIDLARVVSCQVGTRELHVELVRTSDAGAAESELSLLDYGSQAAAHLIGWSSTSSAMEAGVSVRSKTGPPGLGSNWTTANYPFPGKTCAPAVCKVTTGGTAMGLAHGQTGTLTVKLECTGLLTIAHDPCSSCDLGVTFQVNECERGPT